MTQAAISLRKARPEDLDLLQYWDTQPHVIAADPDEEWEWQTELNREPAWREQWMAELNGRPLGFLQIIDPREEETHYWGEVEPHLRAIDIWIGEPDDLGKGYGTMMMQLALKRCFDQPEVTAVLIDPLASNVRAIRFYERLGFEWVEDRNFEGHECKVYQISRKKWRTQLS